MRPERETADEQVELNSYLPTAPTASLASFPLLFLHDFGGLHFFFNSPSKESRVRAARVLTVDR